MAIVKNTSDTIGDIIRIETAVPVIGLVALNSFVDDTENETATRYFTKEFRYSVDGGLNFTVWQDLTTINIQSTEVTRKSSLVIEYRYTRAGSDATDILTFNSLTVDGDFQELGYPHYENSFFNDYFWVNSADVIEWALNVLEKLYKRGIIADYIIRRQEDEDPITADKDFLSFFYTITHFFAILVIYARKFRDLSANIDLIKEFLAGIGLFSNTDATQEEIEYLFANYPSEFQKRGTLSIADKNDGVPDGELRRLVNYREPEEFLMAHLEPHATGWCISKSSPSFNYTRHCSNMIKGYEVSDGITDISKYPISGSDVALVSNEIVITPTTTGINGVYPSDIEDYIIEINDNVSYEVYVKFRKDDLKATNLSFGVNVYDINKNFLSPKTMFDGSDSRHFFETKDVYSLGVDYVARGIIYSKSYFVDYPSTIITDDHKLDYGEGYHLQFTNGSKYILPIFYSQGVSGNGGNTIIKEIKVRPLNFNFTLGKLGQKNNIYLLYNNNSSFRNRYIYTQTANKLIPFNCNLIDKEI